MKRLFSIGSVVAAVALMCGCQGVATRGGATPSGEAPVGEEPVAPIVRQPDNSILHPASGMKFPEQVADFKRQSYRQSGPRGSKFNCDYRYSGLVTQILVTISLYPAPSVTAAGSSPGLIREARPGMADSEYQVEVKKILVAHPETVVTKEKEISLAQGLQELPGRYVEFDYVDTLAGRRQPVTSRLYLFNDADDKWAVKFWVTYPKGAPTAKLIDSFLAELHWTIKDA